MLPPVYFLLALLLIAALHRRTPITVVLEAPVTYFGAVFILAGLGLVLVAAQLFRRQDTAIRPFEESTALVTEGREVLFVFLPARSGFVVHAAVCRDCASSRREAGKLPVLIPVYVHVGRATALRTTIDLT